MVFSEPGTPDNGFLAASSVVGSHLDQGEDLLVELLRDIRPIHLEVEELLRHLPLLGTTKDVAAFCCVVLNARSLNSRWPRLRLFRLCRLLDDLFVLGET